MIVASVERTLIVWVSILIQSAFTLILLVTLLMLAFHLTNSYPSFETIGEAAFSPWITSCDNDPLTNSPPLGSKFTMYFLVIFQIALIVWSDLIFSVIPFQPTKAHPSFETTGKTTFWP